MARHIWQVNILAQSNHGSNGIVSWHGKVRSIGAVGTFSRDETSAHQISNVHSQRTSLFSIFFSNYPGKLKVTGIHTGTQFYSHCIYCMLLYTVSACSLDKDCMCMHNVGYNSPTVQALGATHKSALEQYN